MFEIEFFEYRSKNGDILLTSMINNFLSNTWNILTYLHKLIIYLLGFL